MSVVITRLDQRWRNVTTSPVEQLEVNAMTGIARLLQYLAIHTNDHMLNAICVLPDENNLEDRWIELFTLVNMASMVAFKTIFLAVVLAGIKTRSYCE